MLTVHTDTKVHKMWSENVPAARAKSGDTVRFETLDCFGGQLKSEDELLGGLDWNNVNPATGPLFVEGAMPGDVLKVEILNIELGDHGVMVGAPGEGITGNVVCGEVTKILPVKDGIIKFNDKLSFPVSPMIGVIGTAPKGEGIDTGTPDSHGGNMDCTQIGAGTVLYLPVNTEGALLAMGDLHAKMGDGEVEVCGVEIAGVVTVKVTVLKDCKLPTPFLLGKEKAMTIFSAKTADEACVGATLAMHSFLMKELGMGDHEAAMLLSVTGDLRVCQVVDPEKTFRMEIPRTVTEAYGYEFM
ncbi:MAG: acetamidase/formamidase family protein [Oscillospiraceae bacterium]|nr:acetamidase/formamidase family protein [Oscillospiraceae bacterium]